MEEPFPIHRLVLSCSSLVPLLPQGPSCVLLCPAQHMEAGSRKKTQDIEKCDLGLPCTKQLAYWQPSISTHGGAFAVPNAAGLSHTAPEQNKRQQDGVFFSYKLHILKLALSSFANLGLQHPCWLLPPLLGSIHVDIQFLTHVCPIYHDNCTFHYAPIHIL